MSAKNIILVDGSSYGSARTQSWRRSYSCVRLRAPLEEVELVVVGQQLFNIYLLVAVPKELNMLLLLMWLLLQVFV